MNLRQTSLCLLVVWGASVATVFACQIEYSSGLVEAMRRAGHPVSKRVGNFSSLQECQAVLDQAVAQSGDPTLRFNMSCVDCPANAPPVDADMPPSVDWQRQYEEQAAQAARQAELARQLQEKERARQRAFARERDRLVIQMKDHSDLKPTTDMTKALQQLESVAGSSQRAAGSDQLDRVRPLAEFRVDGAGGIPASSVVVPEPQTPMERLREYVTREIKIAEDRHAVLFEQWQTADKMTKLAAEQKNRKNNQLQEVRLELVSLVVPVDPPPEIKELKDSLEEEARALLAEVEALSEQVQSLETQSQLAFKAEQEQFQRRMNLNAAVTTAEQEPEQAEELLRQLEEGKP